MTNGLRQDGLEKLTKRERDLYDAVVGVSPPRSLVAAGREIGLKGQTCQNYWVKIRNKLGYDPKAELKALGKLAAQRNKYSEQHENLRRVSPEALRRLTEMRMEEALRAAKDSLKDASYSDKIRAVRDLNMVRAQLAGEPTQIMSVDHRVKLMGVMGVLQKEAERRGLVKVQGPNGELSGYKKLPPTIDAEPSA